MSAAALPRCTVDEYLALERDGATKHEFYDGEIFAMAGASRQHNVVALNTGSELRDALLDRDCVPFPSDMRVLCPTGLYAYPDASAVCGPEDIEVIGGLETLKNPLTIVEVLSKSTEDYDRGRKFDHYKTISSLRGYLLLWQDHPRADHYARCEDGRWMLTSVEGLDSRIELPELSVTLSLARLYVKVVFAETENETPESKSDGDLTQNPGAPNR